MVRGFWAHYQPHFFWLWLFTPTWKLFFLFCMFFLIFFFFFFRYLLLHRYMHCIQSLSDWRHPRRTSVWLKSGEPGGGDSPHSSPPKIWIFKQLKLANSRQFLDIVPCTIPYFKSHPLFSMKAFLINFIKNFEKARRFFRLNWQFSKKLGHPAKSNETIMLMYFNILNVGLTQNFDSSTFLWYQLSLWEFIMA